MRQLGSWGGEHPAWLVNFDNLDEELRFLRRMIDEWRGAPVIRNLALQIIREYGCQSRDKKCQAIAIASWVQDQIYYVHELPERFQLPDETLRIRAGDCDDHTTLICSLLESIGIPSKMVCMRLNGLWSHIFAAAVMKGGGLLPLDSTMRFPIGSSASPIEYAQSRGKDVRIKLA